MLAINTAFLNANLAIEVCGKVATRNLNSECKHSENVLKNIDELCDEVNVKIQEIGSVGVIVGPGSFTGLRIGVAIAKALSCANKNLKIFPLTSLDFMAYIVVKQARASGEFVCAINALSGLFYVATFDADGIKLQPERMIDEDEFQSLAASHQIFAIEGDLEGFETIEIDAVDLLEFAKMQKNAISLDDLQPLYLRLSQAEDNLLKNLKKDNKNS